MTAPASPLSPLVGRDHERDTLRDRLAATSAGQGGLVLIGGEAGIGKSALAEALCQEAAEQGALVLVGRCFDLTETPPYGPWAELFGRYHSHDGLPPLPAAFSARGTVGEVSSQAALFQQVLDFLSLLGTHQPLVLLLDDVHWSDPASLDLLRFLVRNAGTLSLLILVTYRSDELSAQHPLALVLPLFVREAHATRLDLPPLALGDICSLVSSRYALSEPATQRLAVHLHARADGNPLFTSELLHMLEAERVLRFEGDRWHVDDLTGAAVPPLVRQVIERRLTQLNREARRTLGIAAVIGQEVPLALWEALTADADRTLDLTIARAIEVFLLEELPDGTGFRFVHALIRETLYQSILLPHRRAWHRRVAELLVPQPISDPDAIAHHFRRASDPRAAKWLVKAGERAERAHAWLTAAARFEAALALTSTDLTDPSERGWLLVRMAWLRRFADPDATIAPLNEAERLALVADDPVLAAHTMLTRGRIRCRNRDLRRGLGDLTAAVAAFDALPLAEHVRDPLADNTDSVVEAWGERSSLALWLSHAGRYTEAAIAALHASEPHRSHALGHVHAALGRPDEAHAAFAHALMTTRATQTYASIGQIAVDELEWITLPYDADQVAARRALATEAEQAWLVGSGGLHPDDSPRLAHLLLWLLEGNWSEARQLAFAVHDAPIADNRRLLAVRVLGQLARYQGEPALAWRLVHAWIPDGLQPGDALYFDTLDLQRLAVALALDAGELAQAREWLETYGAWLAWSGAILGHAERHLLWGQYERIVGDLDRAAEHTQQALAHATAPRQPLALLAAHRLLAEIATQAGQPAVAAMHLDASLALADACAAPYERALTLLARAELHATTGDDCEAVRLVNEVRAIARGLGAQPALARAAALTARLVPTYPAGLSAREVEVLRLLVQGMSNSAIAAQLFVSVRTVERHIRNLYTKIDAHNRADATAYAFRHDLT